MTFYTDTSLEIPHTIVEFHRAELESFAIAGGWLTGEERTAVVNHGRAVRAAAGM